MINFKKSIASYTFIFSLILFSTFIFGYFLPEFFWGTHNFNFFSPTISFTLLGLSFLLLLFQHKIHLSKIVFDIKSPFLQVLIATYFGVLFYSLPIAHDFYGDAFYILRDINIPINKFDPQVLDEILKLNPLKSKVGLDTFYEIHYVIAYLLDVSGKEAVHISGSFYGGTFIFIWIRFVHFLIQNKTWRFILLIVGFTSPLLAVYMGHFETYALSYLAILFWFLTLSLFILKPKKHQLFTLPLLFIIIIQTHITNWMLFPSLLLCYLWRFKDLKIKQVPIANYFTWKCIIQYCLIPVFIIGTIGYVIIFDAHDGPRYYDKTHFEEVVFLPLFTNEAPPYDRYNLLSFNHIWDYICLTWQYSLSLFLLLTLAFTKYRKKINWNSPLVIITGTTTLIFYCLFFVLNPLLGTVVDWDLFSTPAISAFVFVVAIYSTIDKGDKATNILLPILILSLLGTSFWIVNSLKDPILNKIETLGKRNFKTYWIGTSTELYCAHDLRTSENKEQGFNDLLVDLKPFAIKGDDIEYANLLLDRSIYELKANDTQKAINTIDEAITYGPYLTRSWFKSTIVNFEAKNYQKALLACEKLIEFKYKPLNKVVKMGIHISLAAKDYQKAANLSNFYNKNWSNSKMIQEIESRLSKGNEVEKLILLFKKK